MTPTPPPNGRRSWRKIRIADPFAILGAAGFVTFVVLNVLEGTDAPPVLASMCMGLVFGPFVQRGAESVADRLRNEK